MKARDELLARDFATLPEFIRAGAASHPDRAALIADERALTYRELAALMDRVAFALQRDGVAEGGAAAICARSSIEYVVAFCGALAAGAAVAPLAPSSTPASLMLMLKDSGAKVFFLDRETAAATKDASDDSGAKRVSLDGEAEGVPFVDWIGPVGATPRQVAVEPDDPFDIVYSSGTTGAPKGIVQPHSMRFEQFRRRSLPEGSVAIVSTPLYSNTTLVVFLPSLAHGGTAVLMAKFDAEKFLALSQKHRATHAMLVPVQYQRLMARPDFDKYDLSSYLLKFSTSAPFSPALKAEVLKRWPGGLVEYYGMTEGGGSTMLAAHEFPDKLHTVGKPIEGHEIKLIDETGREVAPDAIGEVVGRSASMMVEYKNQPEKTNAAEWRDAEGRRYIRTGDIGRFDEDGFLILLDRAKDMIISGGFNIYPSDIEAEIARHECVLESAVVGVASEQWGETPVAFVVLRPGREVAAAELKDWLNGRLGKTQRVADVTILESLPRSAIGKVLKRELREEYGSHPSPSFGRSGAGGEGFGGTY
jgi:acyl-CoA synthetase (AMP-forming)/AMP-acid ligase II